MAQTPFLLNDKVAAALAVLVSAVVDTVQVLTAKSAADATLPSIMCEAAAEDQEDPKGSGNFMVHGSVAIRTSAVTNEDGSGAADVANPLAANQDLVVTVFQAVQVADLADQLMAAVPDLTVFPGSVQFGAPESGYGEKGQWIDVLHFRCYACGSRLS